MQMTNSKNQQTVAALHTHTHTHLFLTNSFFKGNPFHSGNGCNRGISLIALIITIIVIIILAAISIAGVSGVVERSRYAKFCGDLDAVQDAVSQAYGTKRIQEAQNPDGLKTSEEIYKWVATGKDDTGPEKATVPDNRELYKLADESVLGLDLPKYGNSDWGVDPKTGEVFLVDGFEYEGNTYYSKADIQKGPSGNQSGESEGKIPTNLKVGDYVEYHGNGDNNVPWQVWEISGGTVKVIPIGALYWEGFAELGEKDWLTLEETIDAECKKYINTDLGVAATNIRSLRIEDIEAHIDATQINDAKEEYDYGITFKPDNQTDEDGGMLAKKSTGGATFDGYNEQIELNKERRFRGSKYKL